VKAKASHTTVRNDANEARVRAVSGVMAHGHRSMTASGWMKTARAAAIRTLPPAVITTRSDGGTLTPERWRGAPAAFWFLVQSRGRAIGVAV